MRRPAAFSPVWWQEWGLTAMLVSLLLALFVGAPLVGAGIGQLPFDIFFGALLLSGVVAFSRRRALAVATAVVGVATLAVRWTSYGRWRSSLVVWDEALSIVMLLLLTGLVIEHVFRKGPITGDRIRGAIVAYLLLGLVWGFAYMLVDYAWPGSLNLGPPMADLMHTRQSLAYFSFITLTTVGYGDMTPIHPVARTLAISEALVGQLYPAILIGRLVSLQISSRRGDPAS
jgi:hypothetical protein